MRERTDNGFFRCRRRRRRGRLVFFSLDDIDVVARDVGFVLVLFHAQPADMVMRCLQLGRRQHQDRCADVRLDRTDFHAFLVQ